METRLNEIDIEIRNLADEVEAADEEKMTEIEERMSALKAEREGILADIEEEEKRQKAKEEAEKAPELLKPIEKKGTNKMENIEIRKTPEYEHAFAEYIKTGRDEECRALLTENAEGTVPVPVFVQETVNTAWDRLSLLPRVKRTNFKGTLKVGVEISASPATVHEEGAKAPDEEELALAIVTMAPATIKKWISFSDEILDMNDRAFLEYIYDEITYQILLAAEGYLIAQLGSPVPGGPAVGEVEVSAIGLADFINAAGQLKGTGTPVVITSRSVYAAYKALAVAANYAVDPFDGMEVIFNNEYAFGTDATETAAFVGYLDALHVNFVNGEEPQLKYDDITEAPADLVKVIGRLPVGLGYVMDKGFAKIVIEEE